MGAYPETLSIRAVNQYRKRDIMGYLGLRLYLNNTCAVRDRWARDVATYLAYHSHAPLYHESWHYKEHDEVTNEIIHRRLCIPTPNDIMAESALLEECAKIGEGFRSSSAVYSYQLSKGKEREGIFIPYFYGFKKRHRAIASAAKKNPDGVVVYTDIRKFYPSISYELALNTWIAVSKENGLASHHIEFGSKLLQRGKNICSASEKGILTGPMFSHLIANLIFSSIDDEMAKALPEGYFRYVDDIALVGSRNDVHQAEKILSELLDRIGLSLHEGKRLEVSTKEWLVGEDDFGDERDRISWKTFIGKMKRVLVFKPELTEVITSTLNEAGIRIRPMNYTSAVNEQFYLHRLKFLISKVGVRRSIHRATEIVFLNEAKELQRRYTSQFWDWVDAPVTNQYGRKRRIHGLRRYVSKLIYLADPQDLPAIVEALEGIPELVLHKVILDAISSGDISTLVLYGADAAHSAVHPLIAAHESVICKTSASNNATQQAIAILEVHGLEIHWTEESSNNHPIIEFCKGKGDWPLIQGEPRSYFDELTSLHGYDNHCRYQAILSSAFDVNEDMISDVSQLLSNYAS